MFTGIVEAVGKIESVEQRGGDAILAIDCGPLELADAAIGESIAVNGVCLTVVTLTSQGFTADASAETLRLTSLGGLAPGSGVNLERAMKSGARFGGHLVSGHVDGLAEVVSRRAEARSECFRMRAPAELARYIAHKGSVTIDGTSLTVNTVEGRDFELNIIPHTLENTIIGDYLPGSRVNIEVDIIARYLERLLLGDRAAEA